MVRVRTAYLGPDTFRPGTPKLSFRTISLSSKLSPTLWRRRGTLSGGPKCLYGPRLPKEGVSGLNPLHGDCSPLSISLPQAAGSGEPSPYSLQQPRRVAFITNKARRAPIFRGYHRNECLNRSLGTIERQDPRVRQRRKLGDIPVVTGPKPSDQISGEASITPRGNHGDGGRLPRGNRIPKHPATNFFTQGVSGDRALGNFR